MFSWNVLQISNNNPCVCVVPEQQHAVIMSRRAVNVEIIIATFLLEEIKDCKVAFSMSIAASRVVSSIFPNLKVEEMNKNTCGLLAISRYKARSGQFPFSFVSKQFFELRGLLTPSITPNTKFIFRSNLVCGWNISLDQRFIMSRVFKFTTSVTKTLIAFLDARTGS